MSSGPRPGSQEPVTCAAGAVRQRVGRQSRLRPVHTFQLMVYIHEAVFDQVFPEAEMRDYIYKEHKPERISVTSLHEAERQARLGAPPQPPGPPPPPPRPLLPPAPRLPQLQSQSQSQLQQQETWRQQRRRGKQQQKAVGHDLHGHHLQSGQGGPVPPSAPLEQQPEQQQHQQQQQHQHNRGSSRRIVNEVRDQQLVIREASNRSFEVSFDRRLRGTFVAVHRRQKCALPQLVAGAAAGPSIEPVAGSGGAPRSRPQAQDVEDLEDALQSIVGFICRKGLIASANMGRGGVDRSSSSEDACNRAGSSSMSSRTSKDDGRAAASDIPNLGINSNTRTSTSSDASNGAGGSAPGGGSGAAGSAPQPPLVIHATEGKGWRRSQHIHLKAFVGCAAEYTRLLQQQLRQHGVKIENHNNDTGVLASRVQNYHQVIMAEYSSPALQPIMSNDILLGNAQQLLESRPDLYFRVADEEGQLAGADGLGAVWYGCKALPRLVATLPGRPLNGLSLTEALDCMRALWESELKKRLLETLEGVQGSGGLCWELVPCLAG